MAAEGHQEHSLSIYLWVWLLLFVLSTLSYLVDYLGFESYLRWSLILIFMLAKAGFIIAIFMHMAWERVALIYAILGPPVLLFFLIGLMAVEGDYTLLTRLNFFGETNFVAQEHATEEGH
mgnify:FL=1